MGNITIKSIVRKGGDEKTLAGSLAKHGYSRAPGCGVTVSPYREVDGRYRTGLDPDALYLNKMGEEERAIEIERINALRARLEKATGLDLGPHSEYYSKMWDDEGGKYLRAQAVKLMDGERVFREGDTQEMITAAWVAVHPMVAPSQDHVRRGDVTNMTGWFVSDKEAENRIAYSEAKEVNRALVMLDDMSPTGMKRLARLVDLPVSDSSKDEEVYTLLDKFIKSGKVAHGGYKTQRSVKVFNDLVNMKEETLALKDLVKQSLQLGIYRLYQGRIMQGESRIAETEAELIAQLTINVEDRLSLEQKVESKRKMNS